ncbi:MAG: hypothetical protein FWF59_02210 [Turicibacter sp.]|nr:hypothetical protein [Turicibacter sp.]
MADGTKKRTKRFIQSGLVQGVIFIAIGLLIKTSNSTGAMLAIGILTGLSDLFSSFMDSVKMPF